MKTSGSVTSASIVAIPQTDASRGAVIRAGDAEDKRALTLSDQQLAPSSQGSSAHVLPDDTELGNIGPDVGVVASAVEAAARVNPSSGRPPALNALKSGTRSLAVQAALQPAVEAIAAAVSADQGAAIDGLSVVHQRTVRAFSEVTTMRQTLFERMAGEPVTNKGKARAMLDAYLKLLDRELRLAQLIGLERKARKVASVSELLS